MGVCVCGHQRLQHVALLGRCLLADCGCEKYRWPGRAAGEWEVFRGPPT